MTNIIEVCHDHTGKMEGVKSLSTSVLLNPNCQKNRTVRGSICSHCYADTLAKMYSALGSRLERNTKELTTRFLGSADFEYLEKELKTEEIFRFEAFGDINNEMQLRNYFRICERFPKVRFALYTKMYELVYNYIAKNGIPSNLNLILSSLKVNQELSKEPFEKLGVFKPGQVKVFTVYDKKYIKEHPELTINCGARSCNRCRLCYLETKAEQVHEILKSDRESVELYLALRNPVKREKILNNIENLIEKYDKEV